MWDRRGVYRVWWENLKEIDHLEDQYVDWRIILRWIFQEVGLGGGGMGSIDLA